MKSIAALFLLFLAPASGSAALQPQPQQQAPGSGISPGRFGDLPLYFEPNLGQTESAIQFIARGRDLGVYLSSAGATIGLCDSSDAEPANPARRRLPGPGGSARFIHLSLPGGNTGSTGTGLERSSGRVNYYLGNDPAAWKRGVSTFARVRFPAVYPGIDLVYYGQSGQLEYDFVVAPGADATRIALQFEGQDRAAIDANGDLVLELAGRTLRQHKPRAFQTIGDVRREVEVGYRLKDERTVIFSLGPYDPAHALVIDPVLSYSTYLGGGRGDNAWSVAVDAAGNAYVAGDTLSIFRKLPVSGFQTNFGGATPYGGDGFVAKLDPAGTNLVYLTYLGGNRLDGAIGIAVDGAGAAYVTGYTDSADFPVLPQPGALQERIGGRKSPVYKVHPPDAFVTKLDANGAAVYSTYLGGEAADSGSSIAVDTNGCAYVTGYTDSFAYYRVTNLVCTSYLTNGVEGPSRCRLHTVTTRQFPVGSVVTNLVAPKSTVGGPVDTNVVEQVVVTTPAGLRALQAGFPVTAGVQANNQGGADIFVSKLSADGLSLVYSTYLGGTKGDFGTGIAVDGAGNASVSGWTVSADFPVTNAIQSELGGLRDAVVAKVSADGASLVYATYLGGSRDDQAFGIAVDAAGAAYVTGPESSTDFPSTPGAFNHGGIFRTADAGTNWSLTADGLTHTVVQALGVDPASPGVLYAGTPRGLFKTLDGGASWSPSNLGLAKRAVTALAVDPASPATVYAGTLAGLYRSTDGGLNWTNAGNRLGLASFRVLAFDPGSPSTLYAGTSSGVFKSIDQATNWISLNGGLLNRSVRGLAFAPASPDTIYAATDGGLYKSTNGGVRWHPSNAGMSARRLRAIAIDPADPGTIFVGSTRGVFKSSDAATNWVQLTNGLGRPTINALLFDPVLPSALYAGTTNGLFRTTDGGGSWAPSQAGLQTLNVTTLLSPASSTNVYAGTRGTNFAGGKNDAFLAKLTPDGSALAYALTLGGSKTDEGWGVAVDGAGNAVVVGLTTSKNFPVAGAVDLLQTTNSGRTDVFVAGFDSTGASNLFSIYLGGKKTDIARGVALDPAGNIYVVGQTRSKAFDTTNALQSSISHDLKDAFVTKLATVPALQFVAAADRLRVCWPAPTPEFVVESSGSVDGPWEPVSVPPVVVRGLHEVVLPPSTSTRFFRLRAR